MENEKTDAAWNPIDAHIFWGEIAPCDHVVQIYERDEDFLNLLEDYVCGGILSKDGVIVIATAAHLKSLQVRLNASGISHQLFKEQYFPLDAENTLAKFMVNGWPNEALFNSVVKDLLIQAKKNNRNVRAFGEMVALLWAKGNCGATVQLEHLWNKFAETEAFSLFCAYPKAGITQSPSASVLNICCSHTKMITGDRSSKSKILYKDSPFESAG